MIESSFFPPKKVAKRKTSDYAEPFFLEQKQALAQALVKARIEQGLSQEALAYEAQVERSYVSLIERGSGNPSLRVLCQLAYRLGTDLIDLLGMQLATAQSQVNAVRTDKASKLRINSAAPKKMGKNATAPIQPHPLNVFSIDESPPLVIKEPGPKKPRPSTAALNKSHSKTRRH